MSGRLDPSMPRARSILAGGADGSAPLSRLGVWRLVTLFALLTAVPLALLAYFSVSLATEAVGQEVEAKLRASAALSAVSVQRDLDGLADLVHSYGDRPSFIAALGNGDPRRYDTAEIARQMADLKEARPGIAVTFLTDAKGFVVDILPATPSVIGKDFSFRDWYRGAAAAGKTYVSEAFRGAATGNPLVVVAATPMWERGQDGDRMVGVLGAAYDLNAIRGLADQFARAQAVKLTVTDQRGVVIASPDHLTELVSRRDAPSIAAALAGRSGITRYETSRGPVVASYAPVPGIGWTVEAQVPEDAALAPVSALRATVVGVAGVLGLILAGGLALLASTLRKRREIERSLGQSEERMRSILEAAADAFISMNMQGTITAWNRQAEATFGWTAQEAVGRSVADTIVPTDLRAAHMRGLEQFLETGIGPVLNRRIEITARHRDGRVFPVDLAIWQVASGGSYTFNAFVRDITERKRLDEALTSAHEHALEASRLKSEFLANMSHEIRTPMNGVLGMTELLLDSPLKSEQRQYAETIRNSAEALLAVINDILDFSKIEAGRMDLEAIDFDLRTVVEETTDLLAARAHSKGLELAALVDPNVPSTVRGDPGRVRQVLMNLAGNAVKFTETGEVVVRVSVRGGDERAVVIRFEVTDTGIGISAEDQNRLFRSFSQADASTTRRYGGSGLGLAISKQLVELMGGEVGVVSHQGEGSTFWFTTLLERGAERPAPKHPESVSLRGLRVLVVDDNATNRLILEQGLRGWGMRPDTVPDAGQALISLRAATDAADAYALALLDLNMPGTDGLELARQISADPVLARTRLILLTSSGKRGDARSAREAGITAFLTKPVRQSLLYDTMAQVIGALAGDRDAPLVTRHTVTEAKARRRPRVLVAEDNEVNQKVAARMLERLGYRADVAENGREAVDALARTRYAAVLMDCQMPELDGYEATMEIRRSEIGIGRTPIIAMTAGAMAGDAEKCYAAGMDDYLSKPVSLERLEATLAKWITPVEPKTRSRPTGGPKRAATSEPPRTAGGRAAGRIDGETPLDPAVVASLRELDDAADPGGLISLFRRESAAGVERLRDALADRDASRARAVAHSLKGSSAVVGARTMSEICAELERRARAADFEGADDVLDRLERELHRVQRALDDELRSSSRATVSRSSAGR